MVISRNYDDFLPFGQLVVHCPLQFNSGSFYLLANCQAARQYIMVDYFRQGFYAFSP